MNVAVSLRLLALLVLPGLASASQSCVIDGYSRGRSLTTVVLLPAVPAPSFYFRSMDYEYTIFVPQERLLERLGVNSDLRNLIGSKLGRDRIDLMEYVFDNPYVFSEVQRTVSLMLEHGEAAVQYAGTGLYAQKIQISRKNTPAFGSRTFSIGRTVILGQVDCVVG